MERTFRPVGTTVFAHFASNDTAGSGDDGASPTADVRECGAAVDAAPVYSPTPVLLTHVDYPEGCYEIPIPATVTNGFALSGEYAVFCSLAVDGENPTGKIAQFYMTDDGFNDYRELGSTVYSHFVSTDTDGSGVDGTKPICKVRLCGAAADAAPVYAPTPELLTCIGYNDGCFEVAIPTLAANGFVKDEEYAIFFSVTADGETPTMSKDLFITHEYRTRPFPHTTGEAFALCDFVWHNDQMYRCVSAHSPAADTEPGVGTYWATVWYPVGEPAGRPGIFLDLNNMTYYTWSL